MQKMTQKHLSKGVSPIDRHIAFRLRTLRKHRGRSQEQLAARLKISFQQVQKVEAGRNRMPAGRLVEAAEYLEAPITYFVEGLPDLKGRDLPPTFIASDRAVKLSKMFEGGMLYFPYQAGKGVLQ